MNLDSHCPRCNANLHSGNFSVGLDNDEEWAKLYVDCWACTWNTEFKIKRFDMEVED